MIKQSLNITANQQLQLTPRLQQAIHMLQLSTQELTQEIQTIVDSNIMLVAEENSDEEAPSLETASTAESTEHNDKNDPEIMEENITQTFSAPEESEQKQAQLVELEQHYENTPVTIDENGFYEPPSYANNSDNDYQPAYEYSSQSDSLHDYLLWQLNVAHSSAREKMIGEAIIDAINKDGFIDASLEDIQNGVEASGYQVTRNDVERMLHYIQTFDPIGVGARNVKECLLLQLNALPHDTPAIALAKMIVQNHLQLLADHHYAKLKQHCKVSNEQLEKAINLIQTLKPRPGSSIASQTDTSNIIPDLIVQKINDQWVVALRQDAIPRLQINHHYVNLLKGASELSNNQLVQSHLQEARWLIKCLYNRNETLLKVAACIVKYQKSFLEYGPGAMKPLVLRKIADDLGMHQSTVSRITSRKYIQTPQGTFELKYFFTSHVKTDYGRTCSSLAIRAYIREMIKQENSHQPLTDEVIAKNLSGLGIQLARRTVTKYREALNIQPANKRKRIATEEV